MTPLQLLREALTLLSKPPPPPPTIKLRIYRHDTHTETPCELLHIGTHNGIDHWEIAGIQFRFGYDEIRGLETLPRCTSITFNTVDP
jgi:hypothetical protein